MDLPGVPDSIDWAKVNDFLFSIGIDVKHVTLEGITIRWNAIEAHVLATDEKGSGYLESPGGKVAMHHISIPITRDEMART